MVQYIADDIVRATISPSKKITLFWGDPIEIIQGPVGYTTFKVLQRGFRSFNAFVKGTLNVQNNSVLKFSMVDVQQGDGMVLETPKGKKILIDGGENKLFARYLANRYRYARTNMGKPLKIDAIVVTHGDADHFAGLSHIRHSESHITSRKQLFIHPLRIFHNGLVKAPSSNSEESRFGSTIKKGDKIYITQLVDDFTINNTLKLNRPFKSWVSTINHWKKYGQIEIRKIFFGNDDAFDFLKDENVYVNVLGPFPEMVKVGNNQKQALPFLSKPKRTVDLPLDKDDDIGRISASHTINGHSIALKITFGNVRFMLTGDLNQESMEVLRKRIDESKLQSEIMKAPHHGSADFDLKALEAMNPVVSLISSGDESSKKEHIHPRATLLGSLGKVSSRSNLCIVLCTELAAFFEMKGISTLDKTGEKYFGFERTNFGIIQIRTDGKRVLVYTHSGKENMKEAYAFEVDQHNNIEFVNIKKK